MAFFTVLSYAVEFSEGGGFFTITTTEGTHPPVRFSLAASGAVLAILNGHSPTFDFSQRIVRGSGGMSQDAAGNIVAALSNNTGANNSGQ